MKFKRLIYSYAFCILILVIFFFIASVGGDEVSEVGYYTSFAEAIADAAFSSTENADSKQGEAAAVLNIYQSGKCEATMLKDTEIDKSINISEEDFTLNLNGKTLKLNGCTLSVCGGSFTLNGGGGSIVNLGVGDIAYGIILSANEKTQLTVNQLNISVSARKNTVGIACTGTAEAYVTLNGCNIQAVSDAREGSDITAALYTNPETNVNLKINGGTYLADSKHRLINPETGAASAVGIRIHQRTGLIELDGVSAVGIHSGISTSADMILKNSYCASPTHGGMYNGGVLAAENTTFENKAYSGVCQNSEEIAKAPRLGAMYNGSAARCAVAYLDNCKFINGEASYGLVVSTNYGYQSPTAYISNTSIENLRVDGERAENEGAVATAYIGENVTYNLKSSDGIVNEEEFKNVSFSLEWFKSKMS